MLSQFNFANDIQNYTIYILAKILKLRYEKDSGIDTKNMKLNGQKRHNI